MAPEEAGTSVEEMELQQKSGVKSRSMTLSVEGVVMTVGNNLQCLSTEKVVLREEEEAGEGSWPGIIVENVSRPVSRSRAHTTL